jgi:carbon starvation protein CstA
VRDGDRVPFLKIGTIALLVIGVIIANPKMQTPAINHVFIPDHPAGSGDQDRGRGKACRSAG